MSQKYCPTCKTEKSIAEFGPNLKRKDGLQSMCNPCRSSYNKKWYEANKELQKGRAKSSSTKARQRNRLRVLEYLRGHPCIDCGNTDIEVLEFDHRDASTKEFQIGNAIRHARGWASIQKEIEKCDIRCANCHRKRTRHQLGWWIDEDSSNDLDPL